MDRIEPKKWDKKTIDDIAEKKELVSNINMIAKEKLLQKIVVK